MDGDKTQQSSKHHTLSEISDQQTNPKENACMTLENDALKHHEKRFMILLQIPDLARIRLAPYEIP